jgi:hypothetical protein
MTQMSVDGQKTPVSEAQVDMTTNELNLPSATESEALPEIVNVEADNTFNAPEVPLNVSDTTEAEFHMDSSFVLEPSEPDVTTPETELPIKFVASAESTDARESSTDKELNEAAITELNENGDDIPQNQDLQIEDVSETITKNVHNSIIEDVTDDVVEIDSDVKVEDVDEKVIITEILDDEEEEERDEVNWFAHDPMFELK